MEQGNVTSALISEDLIEENLTSIFSDAIIIRDNFTIAEISKSIQQLLGYRTNELTGEPISHLATLPSFQPDLRKELQKGFFDNSLVVPLKTKSFGFITCQISGFYLGLISDLSGYIILRVKPIEEIKHLHLYLEIEKVRFGHRLKTEISCQDEAKKMMLPSLLLQPLVENAIKFGLYDTIGEITIRLEAKSAENLLHIRVENPFDPETSQTKPGTGFGLNSIQRRLYLLYGRNDLLSTHKNSVTFITELKIPQSA